MSDSKLVDWDHVYLLAWYDRDGKGYLTTWDGNRPYMSVVVTGLASHSMPLWKALVPAGGGLIHVPDELEFRDRLAFAQARGGYLALAWYIEEGFEREAPKQRTLAHSPPLV